MRLSNQYPIQNQIKYNYGLGDKSEINFSHDDGANLSSSTLRRKDLDY